MIEPDWPRPLNRRADFEAESSCACRCAVYQPQIGLPVIEVLRRAFLQIVLSKLHNDETRPRNHGLNFASRGRYPRHVNPRQKNRPRHFASLLPGPCATPPQKAHWLCWQFHRAISPMPENFHWMTHSDLSCCVL